MKVFTIFKKNLKTVSRNWNYFIILFICPLLLIIFAGIMLNSNDFNNFRVGVIDKDPGYDFNPQLIKNIRSYSSIADCIFGMSSDQVSACLYVAPNGDIHQIEIYLDSTSKIIEYYGRQFILQNAVQEQAATLQENSEKINSKLAIYTNSIYNARIDLLNASAELDDQEKTLRDHQKNLTIVRAQFDEIYFNLKKMQLQVNNLKQQTSANQADLQGNITLFRNKKQDINNKISLLNTFLLPRLNEQDYNYASGILVSITNDLNSMDQSLTNIEKSQSDIAALVNNYDSLMNNLDSIKGNLDKLDSDLSTAIERTGRSREKINYFISNLDTASNEISQFRQGLGKNPIQFEFKDAFSVPSDPVLILYPLLISIIITFTSLVLSNMFVLKQINQPSYLRDIISPTNDINFLGADYLINLFFVAIQAVALFLLGVYRFSVPIDSLSMFVLAVFLTSSIFIFVGMSIGYVVKSQGLSMLLTIFLVMLLLIMSDVLAPSVLSGNIIRLLIGLNPFVILNNILRNVMVLKTTIVLDSFILRLEIMLVISMLFAYISKKFSKEVVIQ